MEENEELENETILKEDNIDYKDKYLRALADYDNLKRRKDSEIKKAVDNAKSSIILELLPLMDDIECGIFFDPNLETLYAKYSNILNSIGIERYGEVGDRFDSEIHNAVMKPTDNLSLPSGCITNVLKKGYIYNGKIIRYADVAVKE